MKFCSNCGNQLNENAKFCAQCGTVVGSKPSSSSEAAVTPVAAATAVPAATASAPIAAATVAPPATPYPPPAPPPPAPQPVAATHLPPGAPVHYVPAGQVPIGVPLPPPAQPANKNGMLGTIIVIVLVAGIGYYFYSKSHPGPGTPQANNPPSQQQPPQQQNPPPSGGGNAALLQQQQLDAQWQSANGFIVVNAKWTNSSTVNLASAVMECDQYDTGGTDLSQFRMTLNGPTPPQTWSSYSNMQMGAAANGVNKLVCNLVHVTPTN